MGFLRDEGAMRQEITNLFPVLVSHERLSVAVKRAERSIVDSDSGAVPLSWGDTGTEARDRPRTIPEPEPWQM
jgi:hypothetical protein